MTASPFEADHATDGDAPWVITDAEGGILDRFTDEQERDDALMTGEYPDDAEPAYVSDPTIDDGDDDTALFLGTEATDA